MLIIILKLKEFWIIKVYLIKKEERMDFKVSILLSTYNGEKYIKQQIDSLLNQSYKNFNLYIRDDGSTDSTISIINLINDSRIHLLSDSLGNIGPTGSFIELIKNINSDIYLFCDQDDIWLSNKLEKTVYSINKIGINNLILFHSDLHLVDSNINHYKITFNNHEKIKLPEDYELRQLFLQNCIVGCTIGITNSLVEKSKIREVNYKQIAMHDWWFALVAKKFGSIQFSETPTILYRQHSSNASGTSSGYKNKILKLLNFFIYINKVIKYKNRIIEQTRLFYETFYVELDEVEKTICETIINSKDKNFFKVYRSFFMNKIKFKSFHMNLIMLISYLFKK